MSAGVESSSPSVLPIERFLGLMSNSRLIAAKSAAMFVDCTPAGSTTLKLIGGGSASRSLSRCMIPIGFGVFWASASFVSCGALAAASRWSSCSSRPRIIVRKSVRSLLFCTARQSWSSENTYSSVDTCTHNSRALLRSSWLRTSSRWLWIARSDFKIRLSPVVDGTSAARFACS